MLVVESEVERLVEIVLRWKRDERVHAEHLAFSDHRRAAERRDVAVLLRAAEHEAHVAVVRKARDVVAGEDLRILFVLRRDLHARADGMAELPEVVVVRRGVHAERCCVRTAAVVDLHAAVQRQAILDVQIHIHRTRLRARANAGCHLAVGELIECDDVALDVVEIHDLPLGERLRVALDVARQKIARALHAQRTDFSLENLQEHQPAAPRLLGNCDLRRAESLLVIRLLQRRARGLDIMHRAPRPEERIHRLRHLALRHRVRADHADLADVNSRQTRGGHERFRSRHRLLSLRIFLNALRTLRANAITSHRKQRDHARSRKRRKVMRAKVCHVGKISRRLSRLSSITGKKRSVIFVCRLCVTARASPALRREAQCVASPPHCTMH